MPQGARLALTLAVALAAPLPRGVAAQDVPFRIVVHASNPVSRLTRTQVSRMFLRQVTRWDDRQPVLPVDQPLEAPVRRAFTKDVHRRTVAAVQIFWQQELFAGRGTAPPQRGSDAEVLTYIRQNRNAIGYVRADTRLGADVKAVVITP
jgi:ABC-type phosphate transport system substrate-binding protein